MKTILVPVGGSATDTVVLDTALAAARPFNAHLEFLHVRIEPADAAKYAPNFGFARGGAVASALEALHAQCEQRSAEAERHVRNFCQINGVDLHAKPGSDHVSATFSEEAGDAMHRLLRRARHSDLAVVARARYPNGLPPDFLQRLLLESGRPMLVAGARSPEFLTRKVMICWRESADAARAVTAAMPLLAKAEHVVLATVVEGEGEEADTVSDLIRQAAWHGIHATATVIPRNRRSAAEALRMTAQSCGADLMIMGGYGQGRVGETWLGGCTQEFLDRADLPVLLVH